MDEGTPAPLAALVGAKITGYSPLRPVDQDFEIGIVLHTDRGSVGIADVGDDLAIGDWADSKRWSDARIVAAG